MKDNPTELSTYKQSLIEWAVKNSYQSEGVYGLACVKLDDLINYIKESK